MKNTINWNDFEKIDIRLGTIIAAADFPKAKRPAFQLSIDFGKEIGVLQSSAQITTLYSKEELPGTQVVAIINFPPKQIANFFSQCLVLGVYDENNNVILLQPGKPTSNGQPIG
ncbi:MAG: tRNA-binding protein [Chitinophagaceae bacterium]